MEVEMVPPDVMKCEEKLSMSDEYEDFFFFCEQALHSSQGDREDEAADAEPERDNSQGREYREMRAEREREVTPNSPTVRVLSKEKARNREKRELEREASALRGLLQNLLNHYNARNAKPSLAAAELVEDSAEDSFSSEIREISSCLSETDRRVFIRRAYQLQHKKRANASHSEYSDSSLDYSEDSEYNAGPIRRYKRRSIAKPYASNFERRSISHSRSPETDLSLGTIQEFHAARQAQRESAHTAQAQAQREAQSAVSTTIAVREREQGVYCFMNVKDIVHAAIISQPRCMASLDFIYEFGEKFGRLMTHRTGGESNSLTLNKNWKSAIRSVLYTNHHLFKRGSDGVSWTLTASASRLMPTTFPPLVDIADVLASKPLPLSTKARRAYHRR